MITIQDGDEIRLKVRGFKFIFKIENTYPDDNFKYGTMSYGYDWWMDLLAPSFKSGEGLVDGDLPIICNMDLFFKFKSDTLEWFEGIEVYRAREE